MLTDKQLIRKAQAGCKDSVRSIYLMYADDMLTLANALLNDIPTAEDVVHDVFVKFAESLADFKLKKNLRGYFVTCTRNLARDRLRTQKRRTEKLANINIKEEPTTPVHCAQQSEFTQLLQQALQKLPIEQREAVLLKEQGNLTFKQIAELQNVSTNTAQGRYRYGLDRLRSLLNGEE